MYNTRHNQCPTLPNLMSLKILHTPKFYSSMQHQECHGILEFKVPQWSSNRCTRCHLNIKQTLAQIHHIQDTNWLSTTRFPQSVQQHKMQQAMTKSALKIIPSQNHTTRIASLQDNNICKIAPFTRPYWENSPLTRPQCTNTNHSNSLKYSFPWKSLPQLLWHHSQHAKTIYN